MVTLVVNAEKTVKHCSSSQHRAELEAKVLSLWDSDLTAEQVRKIVKCRTATVREVWMQHYGLEANTERKRRLYSLSKTGERNPVHNKFGSEHLNYKCGSDDNKGYLTMTKPNWMSGGKRVFVHRAVYCFYYGVIPEGHVIHHKDGNPKNNNIDNLEAMTPSEHTLHHVAERRCNDQAKAVRSSERKYSGSVTARI